MLVLLCAVCAWWIVLGSESRRMAQDESNRQNQLLMREVDAHRKTDLALQKAKDAAESANLAKTRYVTGISHEAFEGVRVTPNVYSTIDEVDRFAEAMVTAATKGIT